LRPDENAGLLRTLFPERVCKWRQNSAKHKIAEIFCGELPGFGDHCIERPSSKHILRIQMPEASELGIDWADQLEQNRGWLIRVLRARIGNRHDVEDVFQELTLSVLKQVDRFRSETNHNDGNQAKPNLPEDQRKSVLPRDQQKVAPWLYRLAVRHAVNFYRRSNRISHAKPVADLEPAADTSGPLEWMIALESKSQLQTAIANLRPQDREILMLKFAEKWSYQKMADKLGVTVRNIEYRLLAARQRLRSELNRIEPTSK
jgi:RNA polymerase sigma-70 factor (ECF subfamily)